MDRVARDRIVSAGRQGDIGAPSPRPSAGPGRLPLGERGAPPPRLRDGWKSLRATLRRRPWIAWRREGGMPPGFPVPRRRAGVASARRGDGWSGGGGRTSPADITAPDNTAIGAPEAVAPAASPLPEAKGGIRRLRPARQCRAIRIVALRPQAETGRRAAPGPGGPAEGHARRVSPGVGEEPRGTGLPGRFHRHHHGVRPVPIRRERSRSPESRRTT